MMWMFIFGVFIMSLISTIGLLIQDNRGRILGDEIDYCIIGGPIWIVIFLVFMLIKIIYEKYRKINIKSLVICPDNEIRYVDFSNANCLVYNVEGYEFPKFKDLNEDENLWGKNDRFSFAGEHGGNVRYCPKKVWKKYEPISKDVIELGKKKENALE